MEEIEKIVKKISKKYGKLLEAIGKL